MLRSPWSRVAGVIILLGLLFGLSVWYGFPRPDTAVGAYPGEREFVTSDGSIVGSRVTVVGDVVATDPVVIEIYIAGDNYIQLTVLNVTPTPTVGESLRVHGTVTAPRTINAINTLGEPSGGYRYAYSVSFLAGLWVLSRLIRGWRFDSSGFGLVPRDPVQSRQLSDSRPTIDPEEPDA